MKINYQLILDKTLDQIKEMDKKPRLLIHSCCGPCSSYLLDYLNDYFDIGVFYYNPNIYPQEEFYYRKREQEELIGKMGLDIEFIGIDHNPEDFYLIAKGLEDLREGGPRCHKCYRIRLEQTGKYAKENGFHYFTTSLSISPHKNAQVLNQIGKDLENELGIKYLYSDFKKRDGFKKSVQLSEKYNMYRQEYCGCEFSLRDYDNRQGKI